VLISLLALTTTNAAIPAPPQQFSHDPQDKDQRAECLLQSFPYHPLDRSSAKIYLSRFIERNGFLFDTFADDHELPEGVIMRKCPRGVSLECPKGGFQCLWCLSILPNSSAAFDCLRLHIGHRPHRCECLPARISGHLLRSFFW
jgi:hypothetical protein